MAETKNSVKHYKCEAHASLALIQDGEIQAEFTPYFEKYRGDTVRVGYLETDDVAVQKRLADDGNVVEIDAKEYKDATGPKSFKAPQVSR